MRAKACHWSCWTSSPPARDAPTTLIGLSVARWPPKIDSTTPGNRAGRLMIPETVCETIVPVNDAVPPTAVTGL